MRRRGSTLLETALYLPMLFSLLIGMVELARVSYTYFTLQKILYALGRYASSQPGVNFCDSSDATLVEAKNFALTGSIDGSGQPLLPNLTAEQIQVRVERVSADTGEVGECECSITGCDSAAGGLSPNFIVVSIPDGYSIRLNLPLILNDAIPLRPSIRIPVGRS